MLRSRLEQHFNRIWYRQGHCPPIYRALASVYRWFGQRRFQRPRGRPVVPVIVVGNLTVGGGGKTPLVIALARHCLSDGRRVAVISRGYGARVGSSPLLVRPGDSAARVGDEPLLLAEQTGAPVWVCRQRAAALNAAVAAGAELVLSDDGLQHQALPRSYEICLIDGARGMGNGLLLPAGPLRQPVERLDQVDLVMVKGDGAGMARALPVELSPERLVTLFEEAELPLVAWRGKTVNAVCGIANPQGFFRTLEALGMQVRPLPFPDHHRFKASDLAGLEGPVVVTAKDAVKLREFDIDRPVHVLHVAMRVPESAMAAIDQHLADWSGADESD